MVTIHRHCIWDHRVCSIAISTTTATATTTAIVINTIVAAAIKAVRRGN
jgi:hypothetical protein